MDEDYKNFVAWMGNFEDSFDSILDEKLLSAELDKIDQSK